MLILNAQEVYESLPMNEAIQAIKHAYAVYSAGKAEVPVRSSLTIPPHDDLNLLMPTFINDESDQALAVKIVSIFPHNPVKNLPLIHAVVLVFEPDTGRPLAILEGSSLTAIRTGAASGAATDILARNDSSVLTLFGAGAQGRTQVEAVCSVREIKTLWIYDPIPSHAVSLIDEISGSKWIPDDIHIADSPKEAVEHSDIICTATTSNDPVFSDKDLPPGIHINAVGAFTPKMQEIPADTIARSMVVVDSFEAALEEAGDLIIPINDKVISSSHIKTELGEIILSHKSGRTSRNQITLFKSVGLAVQDAAAARISLLNAKKMGLGQQVVF